MMNTRPLIVLALLLCLSRLVAIAQDDDSRRWAIDFRLSPVKPVVSLNETPDKYYDPLKAGGGPNFSFHLEYFIPKSGFSVVGGYEREQMDFYSGEVSADLSQFMLGGRWYILSEAALFFGNKASGIRQTCLWRAWGRCCSSCPLQNS